MLLPGDKLLESVYKRHFTQTYNHIMRNEYPVIVDCLVWQGEMELIVALWSCGIRVLSP